MGRPLKKLSDKEIIKKITRIRTQNNGLWMALLALAVSARRDKAMFILRKITKNDIAVTQWLSKL